MAVCFTIGELSRLAEKLQVPETPAWSNNPQEAARDIVRHFERSGALAFLVEALREAKPLVEWPEAALPEAPAALPVPPAPPLQVEAGDRPTPIASVSAAAVLASIRPSDAPSSPSASPAAPNQGFAPSLMRRPGDPEPAPPPARPAPTLAQPSEDLPPIQDPMIPASADALPVSRPGAPGPRSAAAWPGTVRPSSEEPTRKPMDPRVLLAAGFAMLLTAVAFAFFLGRASSAAPAGDGSTTTAAEIPPDQAPMALHVTEALGISLERVARACKIEVSSLRGRSLFEVAYRRCGPLPPTAAEPKQPLIDPTPDTDPDSDPDPAPPKKAGGGGGNKLQKVDTPPLPNPAGGGAGGTCLSRCSKSHSSCTSKCGKEPTQSSLYDAYQACLGGCLKELSACKRGCQ